MKLLKIKNLVASSAFALLSSFLISCSSDDTNTSSTNGDVNLKLAVNTTSSSVVNKSSLEANDLTFNSGFITIREVVFDGENGNTSVSRTKEKIAIINYATGEITPEVSMVVPAGNYTSVNLGIELQDENDDPSVVIEGTYTNSDGDIIPIRFEFNSGEVFEANAAQVELAEGTNVVGKITFDAVSWFSTVNANMLDNANLTDGTIIISETKNSSIFDIVADRLDVETQATFE
jgi:hypothetical protein